MRWLVCLSMLLLACGRSSGPSANAGSADSTSADLPDTTMGQPASTTAAVPTSTSGVIPTSESGSIRADVPVADVPPAGCTAIDFLFVVDNSGSMAAKFAQLIESVPALVMTMQDTLAEVDSIHVGVVTSDAYGLNEPGCNTLGALVTQGHAGPCGPIVDGYRFMTEADDLEMTFGCAIQVGASGSAQERPISALAAALSQDMLGSGGCNEGFLRDDAALVVTVISDDAPSSATLDDAHPMADTSSWFPAVVGAKNGDIDLITVVGFIAAGDVSCLPVGGSPTPNFIDFVQMFGDRGTVASVCEPDFVPIFAGALENIDATCIPT